MTTKAILKIIGMHCVSCALNIDFTLEDLGVKSQTNYAKGQTEVEFNPKKITIKQIVASIKRVGYEAQLLKI